MRPVWRTLVHAIPAALGIIPDGHSRVLIPALRERPAPRRSEVRWYPIHASQHDPPSQSAVCALSQWVCCDDRPACGYVDESACARTGPSGDVWTTYGPRREAVPRHQGSRWRGPQVDHTLGPLAHIPTGSTTNGFSETIEEERDPTSCQELTGQNISAYGNYGIKLR